VVEPLRTYFARPDAIGIALFLVFYKFGDNMGGTMVNPFLKDLCFSNAEAGAAIKTIGTTTTSIFSAKAPSRCVMASGTATWRASKARPLASSSRSRGMSSGRPYSKMSRLISPAIVMSKRGLLGGYESVR